MKRDMDLVEMFDSEDGARSRGLRDLEPEADLIGEEKEYQDVFFKVLLKAKINFKRKK